MSESALVSVFKTVDNIKNAIELGQSDIVVADTAKLVAQISTAIAVEGFIRTYSALEGFGRALSLWRAGQAINGQGIAKQQALSAFVAAELVGKFIDAARAANLGGWIYDLVNSDPVGGVSGNGGSGGTGGATTDPWHTDYDTYIVEQNDDGSSTQSWFKNGVKIHSRTVTAGSTGDTAPAVFNGQASHKATTSVDLPEGMMINGAWVALGELTAAQAIQALTGILLPDVAEIARQNSTLERKPTGGWRVNWQAYSSNPNSPFFQRISKLDKPKGMEAFQQWFEQRVKELGMAIDHNSTAFGGDEFPGVGPDQPSPEADAARPESDGGSVAGPLRPLTASAQAFDVGGLTEMGWSTELSNDSDLTTTAAAQRLIQSMAAGQLRAVEPALGTSPDAQRLIGLQPNLAVAGALTH